MRCCGEAGQLQPSTAPCPTASVDAIDGYAPWSASRHPFRHSVCSQSDRVANDGDLRFRFDVLQVPCQRRPITMQSTARRTPAAPQRGSLHQTQEPSPSDVGCGACELRGNEHVRRCAVLGKFVDDLDECVRDDDADLAQRCATGPSAEGSRWGACRSTLAGDLVAPVAL